MEAKKILIIEDDPDNQELLKEIISSYAPELIYASVNDGEEAIKMAESLEFDLVITDMSLPNKNGYDIIKNLRKNKKYQSKPIVALTAQAMCGIEEKIISSGFSEYIAKPCKPKTIIEVIKKYLETKQKIVMS